MKELSPEQQQVYDCIVNSEGKITQLQIARKIYVGCHERFEGYDNPKQSTLRKVRQIIFDLRMNHGLRILSSRKGYYLMKEGDKEDAKRFIDELEVTAKAQAKSYWARYKKMAVTLGVKNQYFEQQGKLFE
jgi:hypothetical protein